MKRSPMPPPKKPIGRNKLLEQKTPMPSGKGFKSTANPPKRKSSDRAKMNKGLPELKAEARRRDGDCCVKCGVALNGSGNVHHRRNRGIGGSRKANVISNLIILCGTPTTLCHGEVTLEPEECDAFGNGWRLSTNGKEDPATVPVNVKRLGWALPLADGSWLRLDVEAVA